MTPAATLLKNIDTSLIYPPALRCLSTLALTLSQAGMDYYALKDGGFRSVAEQDRLFLQGRKTPGPIVTKARGGQSAHNFGIAIDFCRDADTSKQGLQPDWTIEAYEPLGLAARGAKLDSAFWWDFKEGPHVQLDLASHGLSLPALAAEYRKWPNPRMALDRVWRLLDARGPW